VPREPEEPGEGLADESLLDPVAMRPIFEGRSILVGVTGGIAAYKTCTIVSRLVQAGCQVTVVMTESATRFVGPMTFQALSGNHVYTSSWEHIESKDPQHVSLASGVDACVVAPCTMDCMARLAHGMGDDVVSLILAAVDRSRTPVLLAPAMNATMWAQPTTQRNARQLVEDGYQLVGPGDGWQACRQVGPGRIAEPEVLIEMLAKVIGHHSQP
jgi:phosphopantothenoylcysteine synthetase/decarboxylase